RRAWTTGHVAARAGWLGLAMALVFAQMLALTAAEPGGLSNVARRVIDPSFTSHHTTATDIDDVDEFLRTYARRQGSFTVHGPSQPPGRALFYHAVNRWADRPERTQWLLDLGERLGGVPRGLAGTTDAERAGALAAGFLLMAIGALTLAPLAVLAGGRCEPAAVAGTVLLMSTVPSFLLFTPLTDHLLLFLGWTAAALLVEAMRYATRPAALAAAFGAGLTAGAAVFVSFTAIPTIALTAFAATGLLLLAARRGDPFPRRGRIAALAAATGLGFLVVPAIAAAHGLDWPAVYRECLRQADLVQRLRHHRTYWPWVAWNPVDWALFLGLPLAVAWLGEVVADVRAWPRGGRDEFGRAREIPFALALLVVLVPLDLSGRILGETGRIWMSFMPAAVLAVAIARSRYAFRETVVLAIAQGIVLLAIRATWNVPG
ncbi:MAG: hypothetical protein KC591_17000, partial [Gemmatimonadetes bacterium]|nr:hypothetical protein [Gemmatimonadota bacterium]